MRKTIASLGVFWTFKDRNTGNTLDQEEVDGLLFYGYWHTDYSKKTTMNSTAFESIWKKH